MRPKRVGKRWLIFKLTGCLIILGICIEAIRADRLPLQGYTTAEGLPHNEINKIVRDSRGFLWLCTGEGLSRFDGYGFRNYGTAEGLPEGPVTDFLETRNGEFWLGTSAGLVRFDPNGTPANRVVYAKDTSTDSRPMFSVIVPDDPDRRARAITVLLESGDGTIWCGTMRHLFRLRRADRRLELVNFANLTKFGQEIYVLDLLEARDGSIWIAAFGWLCRRWPDGSDACYNASDGLPDNNFHDLLQDHSGQLWAATREHGFFRFHADEAHAPPVVEQTFGERDGLGTAWVSQLFETSDQRFWVATDVGIAEFFPQAGARRPKFKTYTQRQGLLYYGINTLGEDSGGNLWLGSDVGAMKLARDGFITYGEGDGLMSVFAVFGGPRRQPCFRAAVFTDDRRRGGAVDQSSRAAPTFHTRYGCFDGETFTWLKPDTIRESQLGWVGEMTTLRARDGEWWLGTGAGVYRFPSTNDLQELKHRHPLAVYTVADGITSAQIFRLFEDSRGNIWVSAILPNGLSHWERASNTWRDLTNAAGLPLPRDDLARSFGEDVHGNIWVGFSTGIARYREGRFQFFDKDEGLPPGGIQNILSDRKGRLWFASSRSGLIRVEEPGAEHPAFTVYTTAQGLSSNTTEALTEDLQGRIYVGTGRGLDRVDPETGHIMHYTTADGLAPGQVVDGFRDASGELWFGTVKGLSRLVPRPETPLGSPPPILITSISVDGDQLNLSAVGETKLSLPELAADRNQLQINFVGLSFAPGEVLRYQYMLEGSDADWSPPTEQRIVNYASLAPRRYKFQVRAVNSDGEVSATPATITFTILPPFWQRWWFVMLLIVALGAVVYTFYRYRVAANRRTG